MLEDSEETHATDLSARFYTHFQGKKNEITSRLDALNASSSKPDTQTTDFTSLSSEIIHLRKELVDATSYLPSYDRGKCEQQLKVLEETLSKYKTPKAKFSFKRKPASTTSEAPPPPKTSQVGKRIEEPSAGTSAVPSTTNLILSSLSSTHLTISSLVRPTDIPPLQPIGLPRSSDITITDLKNCIVNLFPSTSPKDMLAESVPMLTITALHARDLSRVVLVMPPIEGSILLHDIHNSIVIVGCHQFRMHKSTNTTVLLHVLSNPIIESSHGIRFGAYPMGLSNASPQTLSERPSSHTMVQDFDWIKPSPSPNWCAVDSSPFAERLVELVELVDNGMRPDEVESILREVL